MGKEIEDPLLLSDGEAVQIKKKFGRRNKEERTQHKKKVSFRDRAIIEAASQGLNRNQIAKIANTSHHTVSRVLKAFGDFLPTEQEIQSFQTHSKDILSGATLKLLRSACQDDVIAEADLQKRVNALEKIHKIARLEAGQSTANVEQVLHTVSHDGKTKRYSKD